MQIRSTVGIVGLTSASVICLRACTTTGVIVTTTRTCGAQKSWTLTATGFMSTTTAGSGVHIRLPSTTIPTGLRIATVTGYGVRRMAGPGWAMKRGAGLLTTMGDGSITTTVGAGRRAAMAMWPTETGGGPRSSSSFTSRLLTGNASAGIH